MMVSILGLGLVAPGPEDARRIAALPDPADSRTRRLTRLERMALAAARQALPPGAELGELALVYGTGFGGLASTAEYLDSIASRGSAFGSPIAFQQSVHHSPAGQISILLGCHGPSLTTSARELSGESALHIGITLLESGRAAQVLVIAADEWTETLAAGYRAFDSSDPLSPGEGAAAVLLGRTAGPLEVERCTLTAHPCPVLRFPTREQLRPLLREGSRTGGGPLSVSLAAPNADVLAAETSVLSDLGPMPAPWLDTPIFGFHPSAGLLRLVAAAMRLQAAPVGSACAVHGLALGGGQSLTVVRHVGV